MIKVCPQTGTQHETKNPNRFTIKETYMHRLHLSLIGKTTYPALNGQYIHLAHTTVMDRILMACIDGFERQYIRYRDLLPEAINPGLTSTMQSAENASMCPETLILFSESNGYGAGIMNAEQIAKFHNGMKKYFLNSYQENNQNAAHPNHMFKDFGFDINITENSASMKGFTDIKIIYWHEDVNQDRNKS